MKKLLYIITILGMCLSLNGCLLLAVGGLGYLAGKNIEKQDAINENLQQQVSSIKKVNKNGA